jgi:serine/threonine-protein kinase
MESHRPSDPRLPNLLRRWQEMRAAGQAATPEELCAGCPELEPLLWQLLLAEPPAPSSVPPGIDRFETNVQTLPAAPAAQEAHTPSAFSSDTPGKLCPATGPAPAPPTLAGRYELGEEIGSGGMGVVLRARDPELQRSLAVKVLLEAHRGQAELQRRFRAEAQITGQLQHPGIPPVHEIGTLPDGRPFFAMKLIKGRTLGELLRERSSPGADLPRFLTIFEQVCQTLAFAHARGVIHRDLKPSNVMVGAFGEVQVMDWGLAKVRGVAEPAPASAELSAIATVRSSAPALASQVGAVLGTPAYMAPEQARGAVEQLDEHCDVFGLGAILCVILTGQPPYIGPSAEAVWQMALQGDLAVAYARLDTCAADPDLVQLARACLAVQPQDRPPHAQAVAEAVSAYLRGVQEKLRHAELERTAADLRAVEERKRRRLTAILAAIGLATLILVGFGWRFLEQTRAAYEAQTAVQANHELGRATSLAEQVRALPLTDKKSVPLWDEALAAAAKAEMILKTGPTDAETRQRVGVQLADLHTEAAEVARDRAMLERLEAAHERRAAITDEDLDRTSPRASIVYGHAAAPAYAAAFREYGIDVLALEPETAAAQLRARRIHRELADALDDWMVLEVDQPVARRLLAITRACDQDPFRQRLRTAVAALDHAALRQLKREADAVDLPVATALLLADGLHLTGALGEAVSVLQRARQAHPADFWINDILGVYLMNDNPSRADEAARYFGVALALRPDSYFVYDNLGATLGWRGRWDEARAAFERALALKEDFLKARVGLSEIFAAQGELEQALAQCEDILRRKPRFIYARVRLVDYQLQSGNKEEALRLARDLQAQAPQQPLVLACLGQALLQNHQLPEAATAFRQALAQCPHMVQAQTGLAAVLLQQNQDALALLIANELLQTKPNLPEGHELLGVLHTRKNQWPAALAAQQRAAVLRPVSWLSQVQLGDLYYRLKLPAEAALAYQHAIRLNERGAAGYNGLGNALDALGPTGWERACSAYEKAIALQPGFAVYYRNLGLTLSRRGELKRALAAFRQANTVQPRDPETLLLLGQLLSHLQQPAEAIPHLRQASTLAPTDARMPNALGVALEHNGDVPGALECYRQATQLHKEGAVYWSNLGSAYQQQQQLAQALAAHRTAQRLDPTEPRHLVAVGCDLRLQGATTEAVTILRQAVQLRPDQGWAYNQLGLALLQANQAEEALAAFRHAVLLQPTVAAHHFNLAETLGILGRPEEASTAYRQALHQEPALERAQAQRARALFAAHQFAEASQAYAKAETLTKERKSAATYATARQLCTRLHALQKKQPEILAGKLKPATPEEQLDLALFCASLHQPALAVTHFRRAFADKPILAEQPEMCFHAAVAALQAAEQSKDDEPAALRRQALDWLRAELDRTRKQARDQTPAERTTLQRRVLGWQHHAALAHLPAAERAAWQGFWEEVRAFLQGEIRGENAESPVPPGKAS